MILGFTGTRNGMNDFQKRVLQETIQNFGDALLEAVHGDCMGADTEFHQMIRSLTRARLVLRPGIGARDGKNETRAFNEADVVLPVGTFFSRNRDIVDACDFLVGAPLNGFRKGGTWQTLRYAHKKRKPGLIIFPDRTAAIEEYFLGVEAADRLTDTRRRRGGNVL